MVSDSDELPMSRFWDFVSTIDAPGGKLPLVHATDLFCFREILKAERLEPADCNVYTGQKLMYFFYGRPSYRPHAQKATVTVKSLLPICLVMSRGVASDAVRIMPFDTGAFHRKMMHPPMHDRMKLEDFELTGAVTAPMQLISIFYDSARRYYEAKAKAKVDKYDEFEDLEIDSYFRLLHHRANTEVDDRVTAIEIQLNSPLCLVGCVHAAILPKPYFDRPGIVNQVEQWGGVAIPYHVKEEFVPRELQGAIFDRLTDFLDSKGFLGDD
jgi:hypothetical protein